MTTLDDATLLAYHCGALEPGAQLDVEAALAHDPTLPLRLRELAGRLIEPPPTDPYRIPPPGMGLAGFGLQGTQGMVMSEGEVLRPGDRFRVELRPQTAADATRVVVLYQRDGWEVVFPTRPEEEVMVQALPVGEEGERLLDLAARGRAGRQRWAVALPPKDMPIDWAADDDVRWGDLRRGIALGTVPVASVEIQVR